MQRGLGACDCLVARSSYPYFHTSTHLSSSLQDRSMIVQILEGVKEVNISCIQAAADTTCSKRSTRVKAFKEQQDMLVIQMTIESGAVG